MRMTYSPDVDALAIRLSKGKGHIGTKEIRPGVLLDFDERDHLVGIEILDASVLYDPAELEQLPRPAGEPEP